MSNYYARKNVSRKIVKKDIQPTEDSIHFALVDWLKTVPYKNGFLIDYFHHSPNGGTSSPRQKAKFTRMNTLNGFPDLECFIAKGRYHGLYVELKREKGGIVSADQKRILGMLSEEGYAAVVCRGFDASVKSIEQYMALEDNETMPK